MPPDLFKGIMNKLRHVYGKYSNFSEQLNKHVNEMTQIFAKILAKQGVDK